MRSERFGLILSRQEKTALERLAEHDGHTSMAAILRRLLYREAVRQGMVRCALHDGDGGIEVRTSDEQERQERQEEAEHA